MVQLMKNKYTIKNFRVFDENGVILEMSPVTILTGCNSSGKSSIVKSMVLLSDFIRNLKESYSRDGYVDLNAARLDFTRKPNSTLGNFLQVLHQNSRKKTITLSYELYSSMLGENVNVSFEFGCDENDGLNNASLTRIAFYNSENKLIYSSSDDGTGVIDMRLLVDGFFRYVCGAYILDFNERQWENDFTDDGGMEKVIDEYNARFGDSSLSDLVNLRNQDPMYGSSVKKCLDSIGDCPEVLTASDGSLFYLPLMKNYGYKDKNEFRKFISSALSQEKVDDWYFGLANKICDDFGSSPYSTFAEYFHSKEEEFMYSELPLKRPCPQIYGCQGSIHLPGYGDIYLHQDTRECSRHGSYGKLNLFDSFTPKIEKKEEQEEEELLDGMTVDFGMVYELLIKLESSVWGDEQRYFSCEDSEYIPVLFSVFREYVHHLFENILLVELPECINLSYVSTSIVEVKRTYQLDSGSDFSEMLKAYFGLKGAIDDNFMIEDNVFKPGDFMDEWVNKLNLGKSITLDADKEGPGITPRLHASDDDVEGKPFSEQGYGITQLLVFLLRIEMAIMGTRISRIPELPYTRDNLYSGADEFTENMTEKYYSNIVAIEEPEVHLHPRFQSMLADIIAEAWREYHVRFIIETHSEYLIRKLQLLSVRGKVSKEDISIAYVDEPDSKRRKMYAPQLRNIHITENGCLDMAFGEGFFDEADRLAMDLLTTRH